MLGVVYFIFALLWLGLAFFFFKRAYEIAKAKKENNIDRKKKYKDTFEKD